MASKDPRPPRTPPPQPPEPDGFAKRWLSMGQLAASGTELGLTVAVLTLLGWWLDSLWNTSPWLLLAGAFIGIVGSMYKLWRLNQKWYSRKRDE